MVVRYVNQEIVNSQYKGPSEEERRYRSPSEKEPSANVMARQADRTGTHKSGCWTNSRLAFAVSEEVDAITGKAMVR